MELESVDNSQRLRAAESLTDSIETDNYLPDAISN